MTTQHLARRAAAVAAGAASLIAVTAASAAAAAPSLPVPLGGKGGGSSHCLTQPKSWTLPLELESLACVGILQTGKGGPTSMLGDATKLTEAVPVPGGLPAGVPSVDASSVTGAVPAGVPSVDTSSVTGAVPAGVPSVDTSSVTSAVPAGDVTSMVPTP